jgi:hypothetical protein
MKYKGHMQSFTPNFSNYIESDYNELTLIRLQLYYPTLVSTQVPYI